MAYWHDSENILWESFLTKDSRFCIIWSECKHMETESGCNSSFLKANSTFSLIEPQKDGLTYL